MHILYVYVLESCWWDGCVYISVFEPSRPLYQQKRTYAYSYTKLQAPQGQGPIYAGQVWAHRPDTRARQCFGACLMCVCRVSISLLLVSACVNLPISDTRAGAHTYMRMLWAHTHLARRRQPRLGEFQDRRDGAQANSRPRTLRSSAVARVVSPRVALGRAACLLLATPCRAATREIARRGRAPRGRRGRRRGAWRARRPSRRAAPWRRHLG